MSRLPEAGGRPVPPLETLGREPVVMCRTHESTSALAWLGAAVVVHPSVGQLAAGVVVAAGAGIAPDLDLPTATPAHCFPPLSGLVARGVCSVSGGHRHKTHTLVAVAVVGGIVAGVGEWTRGPGWTLAIVAVCSLFAVRVLGPKHVRRGVTASCAAAAGITMLVYLYVHPGAWLVEAVTVGYAAHLAGDCLSEKGVPLLWPLTSYRFRLPVVPVNSIREHVLGGVAGLTAIWMLASGCASTLQTPQAAPPTTSPPPVSACHATGSTPSDVLPDRRCTPGVLNPAVTQQDLSGTICRSGWTARVRPPVSYTNRLKVRQMAAYGLSGAASVYEEDHRVPLEVGGAPSDPRNLWPELGGSPNPKDRIENRIKIAVCAGRMTLAQGRAVFLGDWWTWRMP